ncbi:MAG: helix-turn-helix domain-containing protein, partial [Coriobacteriales bacterium]
KCSTDYLLGLTDQLSEEEFKRRPPFPEQLTFLLNHFKVTKYRLEKQTGLSEKTVNRWHNGKTQPTVDSLIRLAKYFDCSVDFVLGRV